MAANTGYMGTVRLMRVDCEALSCALDDDGNAMGGGLIVDSLVQRYNIWKAQCQFLSVSVSLRHDKA